MKLHVEIEGTGPDLVLLHGWGLNAGIWDGVAAELAGAYRLHRIDLPGHGRSEWSSQCVTLDDFTRAVAPYVPRHATVLGWSLGGMIALHLASLAPERIAALVLISTTPRFVTTVDWKPAMTQQVLGNFGARLRDDYRATIQDFLALQVRGDERELSSLRELRHKLVSGGLPLQAALEAGLGVLGATDLRPMLANVGVRSLVIAGEYDRVTPPGASRYLAEHIPGAALHVVPRAGHAPFISHAEEFLAALRAFLAQDPEALAATGTTP
ncbi:MAG: pimeloyl-[acyl-carrier protein] methyl ester esterase [Pseudomonadota bacterium]|jgi:pimeloyl-[acyl-carrier protein] methyl ester esterase